MKILHQNSHDHNTTTHSRLVSTMKFLTGAAVFGAGVIFGVAICQTNADRLSTMIDQAATKKKA